jgi:hypothetical protein
MLTNMNENKIFYGILSLIFVFCGVSLAHATNINNINQYAWGENVGWINFGSIEGDVIVSDTKITGYAWGENVGWISLHCENDNSCNTVNYGVVNDGSGNLSGYAWGENVGWISFNSPYHAVSINTEGVFSGYAWGENVGWISFNCTNTNSCDNVNFSVKTNWSPVSVIDNNENIFSNQQQTNSRPPSTRKSTSSTPHSSTTQTPSTPSLSIQDIVSRYKDILLTLRSLGITLSPEVEALLPTPRTQSNNFTRDLELNSQGEDVRRLQQFLNNNGYVVASQGPGSPGSETTIFGFATRAALIRFQQTNNITPAVGYFGPRTRGVVNGM